MKILYVTTIGSTMNFFSSLIKELIEQGNIVDIATNEEEHSVPKIFSDLGCKVFSLNWSRSPLSKGNMKSIKEINEIVRNGKYDIVHCHTPIAAACTRIGCRSLRKNGTKVIYTAHGFHFYKGAPIKNWLIYYPIEWICALWTDTLITINKEDFAFAKVHMHAKKVDYVPGVGIDVNKFANTVVDKSAKRREIGVADDAFLILSVGELNENKNHQVVIREIAEIVYGERSETPFLKKLNKNSNKLMYVLVGEGHLRGYLTKLSEELGVSDRIILIGRRSDVPELLKVADLFVLPSKREGLNVSLQEARASGLECRCYPIRGNTDIMETEDIMAFDIKSINSYNKKIYGLIEH